MEVYCGVDIGTTNVKVLLVDAHGRVLSRLADKTPRRSDGIGPCSDPVQIVDLIENLVVRAAAAAGLHGPLRSISVAGIGEDGVQVDINGKPLGLAIAWFDDRANAEVRDLRDIAAGFEHRTGIAIDAARTAAKWLWLARHASSVRAATTSWMALTDYPAFAWTGTPFMSETLAARTGCYDCIDRTWIPQLLAAAQAPLLPPVVRAGYTVGSFAFGSLLQAGLADRHTAVIAGGHDHPMAAAVFLDINPRAIIDSMGTAELVYAQSDLPFEQGFPESAFPYLARSVPVSGGRGSAGLGVFELSALLSPLMSDGSARAAAIRAITAGAAVPGEPGAGGRYFYPPNGVSSDWESLRADDEAGARAVFEGCAMYTRRIIDAAADAGFSVGPIFTTGGWTQSQPLLALRADVLGQPLHLVDEPHLAALGAALGGARTVGENGAVLRPQLSQRIVQNDVRSSEFYTGLYADYRAQFDRTGSERARSATIGMA